MNKLGTSSLFEYVRGAVDLSSMRAEVGLKAAALIITALGLSACGTVEEGLVSTNAAANARVTEGKVTGGKNGIDGVSSRRPDADAGSDVADTGGDGGPDPDDDAGAGSGDSGVGLPSVATCATFEELEAAGPCSFDPEKSDNETLTRSTKLLNKVTDLLSTTYKDVKPEKTPTDFKSERFVFKNGLDSLEILTSYSNEDGSGEKKSDSNRRVLINILKDEGILTQLEWYVKDGWKNLDWIRVNNFSECEDVDNDFGMSLTADGNINSRRSWFFDLIKCQLAESEGNCAATGAEQAAACYDIGNPDKLNLAFVSHGKKHSDKSKLKAAEDVVKKFRQMMKDNFGIDL